MTTPELLPSGPHALLCSQTGFWSSRHQMELGKWLNSLSLLLSPGVLKQRSREDLIPEPQLVFQKKLFAGASGSGLRPGTHLSGAEDTGGAGSVVPAQSPELPCSPRACPAQPRPSQQLQPGFPEGVTPPLVTPFKG